MQSRPLLGCLPKRPDNFPTSVSPANAPELHTLRDEPRPPTPSSLSLNADEPTPAGGERYPASSRVNAHHPPPCLSLEAGEKQATAHRRIVAIRAAACLIGFHTGHQTSYWSRPHPPHRPANHHYHLSCLASPNAGVIAKANIVVRRLGVQRLEPTQSRDPTPGNACSFSP